MYMDIISSQLLIFLSCAHACWLHSAPICPMSMLIACAQLRPPFGQNILKVKQADKIEKNIA